MSHFIEYYDCGEHVYTQCRCASSNKTVRITDNPCPHNTSKPEYACMSCAHKDHRWDEMRHQRDELLDGIKDLLEERPETIHDGENGTYIVAVPWRTRLRALLETQRPPETREGARGEETQRPPETLPPSETKYDQPGWIGGGERPLEPPEAYTDARHGPIDQYDGGPRGIGEEY